jgi:hypothetical protein
MTSHDKNQDANNHEPTEVPEEPTEVAQEDRDMMITVDRAVEHAVTEATDWTPVQEKYRVQLREWAEVARHELIKNAYSVTTTNYRELHMRVLEHFPNSEKAPLMWRRWIALVLGEVAEINRMNEEPLLPSLVIRTDTKEVSPAGYLYSVHVRYNYGPFYPALHAKDERGKCYAYFVPVPTGIKPD